MKIKQPLKINGMDWAWITAARGYTVKPVKALGPNSGTMRSGLVVEDCLGLRDEVTIPLLVRNRQTVTELLRCLHQEKYATVYYLDLDAGVARTEQCTYREPTARNVLTTVDGVSYWDCGSLVFTTRNLVVRYGD